MAFRELRGARRTTKRSQDYILALFPTFDWYLVPESPRTRSTFDLLSDAFRQFERSNRRVILRPTMNGIFLLPRYQSEARLEHMFREPANSFDFFSTFTSIGHCQRRPDGSVDLLTSDPVELVEWDIASDHATWVKTLSDVCLPQNFERSAAMEALTKEQSMTPDERSAIVEFVRRGNAALLAKLKNRQTVVEWITCIHLILSYKELQRVTSGARLKLVMVGGLMRPHPAIVASNCHGNQALSIFVPPTTDIFLADVAFLGYPQEDTKCFLVGSIGGYIHRPSLIGPKTNRVATNAWDFWVERSGVGELSS